MITASADGTARIWTIDPLTLRDKLRARIGPCLTPEQRQRYFAESRDDAAADWEKCEYAHGRTPNKLPGARDHDDGGGEESTDKTADGRATTEAAG